MWLLFLSMGHYHNMVIIIKHDSIPVCGYNKQILVQYTLLWDIICLLDSISSYGYYIAFWFNCCFGFYFPFVIHYLTHGYNYTYRFIKSLWLLYIILDSFHSIGFSLMNMIQLHFMVYIFLNWVVTIQYNGYYQFNMIQ